MHTLWENLQLYMIQQLSNNGLVIVKKIVIAIFVFVLVYLVIRRVVAWSKKKIEQNNLGNHNDIQKVSNLIASIVYSLLMIFNFLIMLQILGIDVAILM